MQVLVAIELIDAGKGKNDLYVCGLSRRNIDILKDFPVKVLESEIVIQGRYVLKLKINRVSLACLKIVGLKFLVAYPHIDHVGTLGLSPYLCLQPCLEQHAGPALFSPNGVVAGAIIKEIEGARTEVFAQAHSFISALIARGPYWMPTKRVSRCRRYPTGTNGVIGVGDESFTLISIDRRPASFSPRYYAFFARPCSLCSFNQLSLPPSKSRFVRMGCLSS